MRISLQHRITSLLLAFIMLFSSVGFSMDIHYCGGEIESIGFFTNAAECEMMQEKTDASKEETHASCPNHKKEASKKVMSCHAEGNQLKDMSCCHNEKFQLESSSEFTPTADEVSIENIDFTFTAVYFLINQDVIAVPTQKTNYQSYLPPLLTEDVAVLHQVFII